MPAAASLTQETSSIGREHLGNLLGFGESRISDATIVNVYQFACHDFSCAGETIAREEKSHGIDRAGPASPRLADT